jgi:hypothetical protein
VLNIPEENPKMNLPIAKHGVKGIITIQDPTIVTQSASIIASLNYQKTKIQKILQ